MDDARVLTIGAASGNFFLVTADVTREEKTVGMKRHRKITGGAEGLPTTFLTDGKGRRATAVVKN